MYQQKILVANAAGQGATTVDSSLVDPWASPEAQLAPGGFPTEQLGSPQFITQREVNYYRLPFPMVVRPVWYSTAALLISS